MYIGWSGLAYSRTVCFAQRLITFLLSKFSNFCLKMFALSFEIDYKPGSDFSFNFALICVTGNVSISAGDWNVRLVGGSNVREGRVEVNINFEWGTVCDDSWGTNDARVVCRQLSFGSPISAPGNARFGQGSGQIFLDDVHCTGSESSLASCSHRGKGMHNCMHYEDASVVCGPG